MAERTLEVELRLRDRITAAMKKVGPVAKRVAGVMKKAFTTVTVAVTAVVAVMAAAGRAAVGLAQRVADLATEMQVLAFQAGLTREQFNEIRAVADQTGAPLDRVIGGFKDLARNMRIAQTSGGEALAAFQELGVEFEEDNGTLRDTQAVLIDVLNALDDVPDPATRTAIAMQLMSDNAADLVTRLPRVKEGFEEAVREAREFGLVLDDEAIKQASEFEKQAGRVKQGLEGLAISIGQEILPAVNDLARGFADRLKSIRINIVTFLRFFKPAFKLVLDTVLKDIGAFFKDVEQRVDEAAQKLLELTLGTSERQQLEIQRRQKQQALDRAKNFIARFQTEQEAVLFAVQKAQEDFERRLREQGIAATAQFAGAQLAAPDDVLNAAAVNAARSFQQAKQILLANQKEVNQEIIEEEKSLAQQLKELFDEIRQEAIEGEDPVLGPGAQAAEETPMKVLTAWQRFQQGFNNTIDQIIKDLSDFEQAGIRVANGLAGAFQGAFENTLFRIIDEGITNTKQLFKSLVADILRGLAQIAAREAALQLTRGVLSGVSAIAAERGGIIEGRVEKVQSLPIRKFQQGGIADRPTVGIFGEGRGAEAFVPLPGNRRIPVQFQQDPTTGGAPGAKTVNANFTVVANDARGFDQLLAERREVILNLVQEAINRDGDFRRTIDSTRG